jgi:manganese/zinc/iron transport system substrate-binding protein
MLSPAPITVIGCWLRLVGSLLLLAVGLVGCRDATPLPPGPWPVTNTRTHTGNGPVRVVVTVGMVADMVQAIGGSHVEVDVLCGPGVDPHLFKPTRDHVARLLSSDAVIFAGLHLEGKLHNLLLRLSNQHPVYAVTRGLPAEQLLTADEAEAAAPVTDLESIAYGQVDPHVWMDVELWARATEGVAQFLSTYDPAHAQAYADNATAYRAELLALHVEGQGLLSELPSARRLLVTSHDAFRYFGRAYGLQVEGVQGLSTESEAGLQRINGLVDLLVERQLPAVFIESSISPKNMQALLEGVQSRGQRTVLGGELYADALGPADSTAANYRGMMRHNFHTIARALNASSVSLP